MKFDIIYLDCPWTYTVWSPKGNGRSAGQHYTLMKNEDIMQLKVGDLGKDDSVCISWVTSPCLIDGIKAMEAWGYKYKTILFTWVKTNKKATDTLFWGCGHYTRANTELCILGTKGKGLKRVSASVHQVIKSPVDKHSKKPEETRDRIIQLFGDDKDTVELFSRPNFNMHDPKLKNWKFIGNEITGNDITVDIEWLKNL